MNLTMKFISILLSIPLSMSAMATNNNSESEKTLLQELDVKRAIKIIPPRQIADNVYTPYSVHFVKAEAFAPSCFLLSKDDVHKKLELFSTGDDPDLPNCNQVRDPVITKNGLNYFATYGYDVEDPRKVFTAYFQVIKLSDGSFYKCKEDSKIDDEVSRLVKRKVKLDMATNLAIKKIGCTIDEKTFD